MAISIFSKKSLSILSLSFLLVSNSWSQSISQYGFSTAAGTYNPITTAVLSLTGGTADEGYYDNLSIGFDFWYMGTKHTKFSVSTNGWMVLGQNIGNATNAAPTNNLNTGALRPVLAPLWDNLAVSGDVRYSLTGTEPTRILTVQWSNMQWNSGSTSRISFQAKLYEATGEIRFIYTNPNTTAPTNFPSASIGISGPVSRQFASVTPATTAPVATAAISYDVEKSNIAAKPANNVNYLFKSTAVAAPTNLTFTAIGPNHLTLNWTDVAADNIGYVIYRSTDATTGFSQIGSVVGANATSYTDTGLDQLTTYYYKVYAVRESLSTALSGNITTIISCLETLPTDAKAYYKLNGNANDAMELNQGTFQGTSIPFTADRFGTVGKAYNLNGTNNFMSTATSYNNPQNFAISLWFKTTTTSGGVLMGFASSATSTAFGLTEYTHDRKIYMTANGTIYFAVYVPGTGIVSINTPMSFNDGDWHQVTGVLSNDGMSLYLDGLKVGSSVTPKPVAQSYVGYWRVGQVRMESSWPGWTGGTSAGRFQGAIDDVLFYNKNISDTEAKALYPPTVATSNSGPVCAGYTFDLTATTFVGATYQWTGPNGYTSTAQNPVGIQLTNSSVGVYTVAISKAGGCTTTAATRVDFNKSDLGLWAGKLDGTWINANNWCAGTVPTSTVNVTIPTSGPTFNPILTTVGQSKDIAVQSGRSLTISGAGDLQVAGAITNAGTITASDGKVTMNGNIAQVIPANVFASNLIKDLTLNNTAGVTLNGGLRLTGLLTPSAGIFQTGGNLTLASSETATASVATIPANTSVRGSVKVERFLKGGAMNPYRTYRMLSSPVYDNTADFINTDIQGNRSAKFSQLIDDMIISGANGAEGSFDVTHNNQVSAWTYSGGFTPITNINTAVNAGKGMYVFFRGNRNNFQAKTNAPFTNPEDVVMDFDGILNQQDITVSLPLGGSFLGNPYAATIDWDSENLTKVNLNNAIWIWNPSTRSYATYTGGVGNLGGSNYIASGQSFFVQTTAAGSITFREGIKATSQQPPALLMAVPANSRVGFSDGMTLQNFDKPRSLLRISMKPLASYGEDETVVVFNEGSSAAFDEEDANISTARW